MQRSTRATTVANVPSTRNATPATMKRVGGGYAMRTPATRTSTPAPTQQRPSTSTTTTRNVTTSNVTRINRANAPRTTSTSNVARINRANAPRTTSTSTSTRQIARIPRASPAAARVDGPVVRAGVGARAAATSTTRVPAVSTLTSSPAMPVPSTSESELQSSEIAQLKRQNAELLSSLEMKNSELESANQQIGALKADVEELSNRLEASRQSNVISQSKLEDAYKANEKDGEKLKELLDGQTILKRELARSKAMLEVYEVYMENQQPKRIDPEIEERQTALLNSMKLFYQQRNQRTEERIKQLEQENMEWDAEFVNAESTLEQVNMYLEDQLSYSDSDEETKDDDISCVLYDETAENRSTNQEMAVHERRADLGYVLIAPSECMIKAQRLLDRLSTGQDNTQY